MAMMPPPMVPQPMPPTHAPTPSPLGPPTSQEKTPPKSVIDTAHADMVHDAQLDFYGRRLATCSSDRTIKIFHVDRNGAHRPEATLEGHTGPVWQVAWAHPTRHGRPMLASASHDGRVIVWIEDAPGMWRNFYEYAWHASSVNSVAFAPHEYGLIFACASSDGFVSICSQLQDGTWDERRVSESRDGGAHTHPLGANSVAWGPAITPGGLWMPERATPPPMRIVTAGCDHLIKIWKFDNDANNWLLDGEPLKGHREMVRCVSWAPNVGLPRSIIASAGQDKKVILWNQELESDTSKAEWTKTELPAFAGPVWSVSWSPTGSVLGVAYGDDKVTLWKQELDGSWKNVTDVTAEGTAVPESS
ncbi:unnamed protein product [Chondrus crispus]|uniref:Uncharacterized protein n=1 Tax=Chondrus crispus TaxID=2769 RepID=R7QF23_CHOCR|nr:unnamed protein product [Chondrus crispus]CDF36378.1 unnamed protein product [Chondrus crispus]|eukprot:XP_005716197.1 unnamed protein product [Chondrus crispus]